MVTPPGQDYRPSHSEQREDSGRALLPLVAPYRPGRQRNDLEEGHHRGRGARRRARGRLGRNRRPAVPDHVVQPDQGRHDLALRSLARVRKALKGQQRRRQGRRARRRGAHGARARRATRADRGAAGTRRHQRVRGSHLALLEGRRQLGQWSGLRRRRLRRYRHGRVLARQGRGRRRLPVHVGPWQRVQLAGRLGRKRRRRILPRSHGLEHEYGQAEQQLGLDRAGQRQGEPRRHDAVRHLRKRQLAAQASQSRMLPRERRGCPGSGRTRRVPGRRRPSAFRKL